MTLAEIFESLLAIPSPSRREKRLAQRVGKFALDLGFAVEEDAAAELVKGDSGNLFVRLPARLPAGAGQRGAIVICSHLDTVETGERPVNFRFENGEYFSDGQSILGADCKAGIACMLHLLQRLSRDASVQHPELRFIFTICEETELLGGKFLPDAWLAGAAMAYAVDHGNPFEIVRGAPSKKSFHILACGIGGHAMAPERRINAAHLLATACSRLPQGRLDEASTCNLGILRSGTAINVIPAEAVAEYELRSHDSRRLEFHAARIREILEHAASEARIMPPGECEQRCAEIHIREELCYHAYRLADGEPVLERARAAVEAVCGRAPEMRVGQGGSDANAFNRRGVPSCVVGCGMHGAHSFRERAVLAEMEQGAEILWRLATS